MTDPRQPEGAAGPARRERTREGSARRRLFFALWPDAPFRERLEQAVAPWLAGLPGRAQPPAQWHITLCFLGAVAEELLGPLQQRAAQLPAAAFELHFTRLEYWRGARVLGAVARPIPEPALALARTLGELARELGIAPDVKPLRPHVTLMRALAPQAWRERRQRARPARLPAFDLPLPVREFHLMESGGDGAEQRAGGARAAAAGASRYRSLARFGLPSPR